MAETRIRLDKQIQKAPAPAMVPLSDGNGELQFAGLAALIKQGETLTRLNSVEVVGGNLVIKYTPEDGNQQVVSTPLNFSQQDIKVTDARLDNPSTGVYRLLISENDGSTFPVDLSALLASVTQSTEYLTLTGNGTPGNPLKVEPTQKIWDRLPKVLDNLDDVTINQEELDLQTSRGGTVVLVWDYERNQWIPRSVNTLDNFQEITETFRDVKAGNTVSLQVETNRIIPQSLKVFRNGLRQEYGVDYDFGKQGSIRDIVFYEPFSDRFSEKVIVDYRPAVGYGLPI